MGASLATDDILGSWVDILWSPDAHPYTGPLLLAARSVLELSDGEIGINDAHYLPVIEARRILYGANDGFVAAFDRHRFAAFTTPANENPPVVEATEVPLHESSAASQLGTTGIRQKSFSLTLSDPELEAGIRALGKLIQSSEPAKANAPVALDVERKYMTMAAWGQRHGKSVSTVKHWRRLGLPTNGIEGHGVRVKVREADDWVDAGGPKLALAAAGAKHARREGK
jgi:hypothetical protein